MPSAKATFDPAKHPRNAVGRFRALVEKMREEALKHPRVATAIDYAPVYGPYVAAGVASLLAAMPDEELDEIERELEESGTGSGLSDFILPLGVGAYSTVRARQDYEKLHPRDRLGRWKKKLGGLEVGAKTELAPGIHAERVDRHHFKVSGGVDRPTRIIRGKRETAVDASERHNVRRNRVQQSQEEVRSQVEALKDGESKQVGAVRVTRRGDKFSVRRGFTKRKPRRGSKASVDTEGKGDPGVSNVVSQPTKAETFSSAHEAVTAAIVGQDVNTLFGKADPGVLNRTEDFSHGRRTSAKIVATLGAGRYPEDLNKVFPEDDFARADSFAAMMEPITGVVDEQVTQALVGIVDHIDITNHAMNALIHLVTSRHRTIVFDERSLEESVLHALRTFRPQLHPRDRSGKFRDVLGRLEHPKGRGGKRFTADDWSAEMAKNMADMAKAMRQPGSYGTQRPGIDRFGVEAPMRPKDVRDRVEANSEAGIMRAMQPHASRTHAPNPSAIARSRAVMAGPRPEANPDMVSILRDAVAQVRLQRAHATGTRGKADPGVPGRFDMERGKADTTLADRATGKVFNFKTPTLAQDYANTFAPHAMQVRGKADPGIEPLLGKADPGMPTEALHDRWANLDRALLPYAGHPNAPVAKRIIRAQKSLVKAMHHRHDHRTGKGDPGLPKTPHDVVVVGAGPAGLSAAIYGGTEGLDTVMVDANPKPGGQSQMSSRIENVLGFPAGITGRQLAGMSLDQAQRTGADTRFGVKVTKMDYDANTGLKHLTLSDGTTMDAKAVVIAGGVQFRHLNFPGENSKDVIYGDSTALKRRTKGGEAIIIGGANSAGQAAIDTASKAKHVTILVRHGSIRDGMSEYLVQQLEDAPNVTIRNGEIGTANLDPKGNMKSVTLKDGTNLPADGIGLFIGSAPQTDWSGVKRERHGFILVGQDAVDQEGVQRQQLETNIPGVFAAGDVRSGSIHRVITAAADGAAAISMTHSYLSTAGQMPVQEAAQDQPNDEADNWLDAVDAYDSTHPFTGADPVAPGTFIEEAVRGAFNAQRHLRNRRGQFRDMPDFEALKPGQSAHTTDGFTITRNDDQMSGKFGTGEANYKFTVTSPTGARSLYGIAHEVRAGITSQRAMATPHATSNSDYVTAMRARVLGKIGRSDLIGDTQTTDQIAQHPGPLQDDAAGRMGRFNAMSTPEIKDWMGKVDPWMFQRDMQAAQAIVAQREAQGTGGERVAAITNDIPLKDRQATDAFIAKAVSAITSYEGGGKADPGVRGLPSPGQIKADVRGSKMGFYGPGMDVDGPSFRVWEKGDNFYGVEREDSSPTGYVPMGRSQGSAGEVVQWMHGHVGKADPGIAPVETTVGITPFRGSGSASGTDYFDTTRYKGFESAVNREAEANGLAVGSIERSRGVWNGGGEPSALVRLRGDADAAQRVADKLAATYDQDAAILFRPNPQGQAMNYVSRGSVDPRQVEAQLASGEFAKIEGATVDPNGHVHVIDLNHGDAQRTGEILTLFARLGQEVDYTRGDARLRTAGTDYEKAGHSRRRVAEASGARSREGGRRGGDDGDLRADEAPFRGLRLRDLVGGG